jgi:hypothetical protein
MNVAEGASQGIDKGADDVQTSLESMVSPEGAVGAAGAPQTTNVQSAGDVTVNLTINAPSGDAQDIRAALQGVLDDLAIQIRGGMVPA